MAINKAWGTFSATDFAEKLHYLRAFYLIPCAWKLWKAMLVNIKWKFKNSQTQRNKNFAYN